MYSGFLVPANETEPPLPDGVPKNTIQLLLGDDLRVLAANSENHVLLYKNKPFLTIGIEANLMRIKTEVVDFQNRHIARIINNEFQISQENAFNPLQPDRHSLIVRDAKGNEVLNIRFVNKKTIRVTGRFHLNGYPEPFLILQDDGIRWPGGGGIGHLTIDLTQSEGGMLNFQ